MAVRNLIVYSNIPKVENERICPICSEEAPAGGTHHPHYGGICCYSCRAFFRRANQRTKKTLYQCKADGKCVIVQKSKQMCKRCRYDKCLANGMDPKWILSNDEKRIRFKHFFKKKDELASLGLQSGAAGSGSDGPSTSTLRGRRVGPYDRPAVRNEPRAILPRPAPGLSAPVLLNAVEPTSQTPMDTFNTNSKIINSVNSSSNCNSQLAAAKCPESMIGPKSSRIETNIPSGSIPLFQASPQKIILQPQTAVEPPALKLTTAVLPPHHGEPQLVATTNAPNQFPSQINYPLIQQASAQLIQQPLNPIIQTSTNRPSININLDYCQELAPSDIISINGIPYVRQDQIVNRNFSATNCALVPNNVAANLVVPNQIQQNTGVLQQSTGQPVIILIPNPIPMTNSLENPISTLSQENPTRSEENREISAQSQLDNQDVTMDHDNQEDEKPSLTFAEPASRESSMSSDILDQKKASVEIDNSGDFLSLRSQLSTIMDAFTLTSGKLSLNSPSAQELILNHQRLKSLEKTTLVSQLSMIASMLTEFASTQFLFLSLTKEDQVTLLKNNIPLYLQYVTARYFSAETGLEQLNWILEGQITIDSIEEVTRLTRISLKEYNTTVNLFPTSEITELYSHFSENVGIFYPFPQHCNGLVANMLIYYTNEFVVEELKEAKRISCIFNEAKELVKLGYSYLDRSLTANAGDNIGPLLHTLTRMKNIFGTCQIHSQEKDLPQEVPQVLALNFTDAEDNWIKLRFNQFQTQFLSVEPTSEYYDDLLKRLLYNRPVSENYMTNWHLMMSERFRRVLKIHPEFEKLTDRDQETLWKKNKEYVLALEAVRLNLVKTGKDQLRIVCGIIGSKDRSWEDKFNKKYDLDTMKSTHLNETDLHLGRFDEACVMTFYDLMKEVSEFCVNEQMYQLVTLLMLLDTEGMPYSPSFDGILRMRQIYLKFLQRKFQVAECTYIDYATFKKTLKKVKILSAIMENLFH